MKPHQKLSCWTKSMELVKTVYQITSSFPTEEKYGLTSQMRRSAVSIPVNIAEGAARKSKKEFIQFLYISLGSMTELDTLVLISSELEFITKDDSVKLITELDSIGKIIFGLIRTLQNE